MDTFNRFSEILLDILLMTKLFKMLVILIILILKVEFDADSLK
jgi:hypothetical protein